jgi:Zn-dependent protease
VKTLLIIFGGVKFAKLLGSGGTMILSLVLYATIWGWRYAAGFLTLLLVHELGVAARQRGLAVGLPTFIPFVGAWIELKQQPIDAETEAYVAVAGPIAGTVASVLAYFLAEEQGSSLLLAVAYSGLFLNLFNLLPLAPLDGGRIVGIINPRLWLFGLPLLIAFFAWRPSPLLLVIGVMCLPYVVRAWNYRPDAPENIRYYGVPAATKIEYGLLYLGLAAFLAIMSYDVHDMLATVRR